MEWWARKVNAGKKGKVLYRENYEFKCEMVKCSRCGREVKDYIEIEGRILCEDCYFEEMESAGVDMTGEASGGG